MKAARAMTLVECIFLVVILLLLVTLAIPSFVQARELARLAVCKTNLSAAHRGLMLYANLHRQHFPPFAFHDLMDRDLILSGHWGGSRPTHDRYYPFRKGIDSLNLCALLEEELIGYDTLICPSAAEELRGGQASWFANTNRWSSYCMRFPYSEEVFAPPEGQLLAYWGGPIANLGAPHAKRNGPLLGIYLLKGGGQKIPLGQNVRAQQVPLLRWDMDYPEPGGVYSPARGAILAEAFWRLEETSEARPLGGTLREHAVRRGANHQTQHCVLYGDGAVAEVPRQDWLVQNARPNSSADAPYGVQAAALWRYFEANRDRP